MSLFIVDENLRADIKAGTTYDFSFTTRLDPAWNLKTFLDARNPDTAFNNLLTQIRAGKTYDFTFETKTAWGLKTEIRAGSPYAFSFFTQLPDDWSLKTSIKARKKIPITFTTAFNESKRLDGVERASIYRASATDSEVLTLPINWVTRGVDRTFSLDIWYGKYQQVLSADDVRLSIFTFGTDNRLGKEIIDNGYFQVKESSASTYTGLTASNYLSLGPMEAHSKKAVDIKLSIPAGAASVGLVFFGLKLEVLRSVIFAKHIYGEPIFGEYRRPKPGLVLVKLHIAS